MMFAFWSDGGWEGGVSGVMTAWVVQRDENLEGGDLT